MFRVIQVLVVVFVVTLCGAYADGGSIPFKTHVQIFEPNQRAMIAWNGREEILLLTTDLYASEPTKVLEVVPLPAEPQVKLGDTMVFQKAVALINTKVRQMPTMSRGGGAMGGARSTPRPPAGEVTFHKMMGAHDISVTHVLDGSGFVQWVNRYLKSAGVENPTIPSELRFVIDEYIREGITWFVFDVVELGVEPMTKQAIQYKFRSDSVFYPLKITRVEQGHTSVDLLILTPKRLYNFVGVPQSAIKMPHPMVTVTKSEMRGLGRDMARLLRGNESAQLRIWQIYGELSTFTADVVVR